MKSRTEHFAKCCSKILNVEICDYADKVHHESGTADE